MAVFFSSAGDGTQSMLNKCSTTLSFKKNIPDDFCI